MVEALPGQAYWQGLFSSTKRKLSEPAIFTARPKSRMLKKKKVKIKIKKPKKNPTMSQQSSAKSVCSDVSSQCVQFS